MSAERRGGSAISERIEANPWGRRAIGILVAVLLASQVVTHLPESETRTALHPTADRALRILGSEQAWGVFSPNPRGTSLDLEARVTFADGSTATWEVPEGPVVGANLRFYRWRKWLERVRADRARAFWEPTAAWIADQHRDGDSPPVRVELVRRYRTNVVRGPQPAWDETVFYTLDLEEGAP